MNKYGIDNFAFQVIEECDYEVLDDREKYWINKLNTLEPHGYNIQNGGRKLFGEDNPFYGKHHTEETKRIISEKNTGRIATDEERKMRREINMGDNNPFYGKRHSEETKRRIKETSVQYGNYEKSSERMKLHNPNDGTLFSKATMMLDKTSDILDVFESATKAGEYIKSKGLSKAKFPSNAITEVCRGTQKTAYGFDWKYLEPTLKCNLNERTYGYVINRSEG